LACRCVAVPPRGNTVPRVLVADDNANIQKMVVLALEERGIDVVAVGNGEAAVRKLPDVNPDLVLADVFMPVRNGYEVCEFVKKDPRFSHIPVILLVGAFDPLDEKEARRVGADGVLKKPFVPPDPLIAMVMSALEKNPKVAAELAKAKEVIAAPPPPIEVLEAPLRSEPKPLPEYPEPTPEEAAAIYGFGKGVRALAGDDDEEEEDEEKETRKSRKSKSAKAPKTPVASVADDDDDFDNAATTSDWRRNAADFEVPENVAQDLPIDAVDPSIFPSEKDVPPRRVREEAQPEVEVAAPPANAHSWADAVQQSEPEQKAADEATAGIFGETSSVESAPDVPRATWLSESDDAPKQAAAQEPVAKQESSPVSHDEPKHETRQEPAILPRATEWMDMMAPPPSEYPDGGWMSNLSAPRAETPAPQAAEKVTQPSHVEAVPNAEETAASEIAQAREHAQEVESQSNPDKRVFSDAPAFGGSSYHFASESRETDSVAEEVAPEPVASNARDSGHELMVAPADAGRRQEDDSWHAASEPLLVDEEHTQPSDYAPAQDPPQPAEEHAAISDPAPPEHLEPSVFEPAQVDHAFEEFSERIPTLPPPNREALMQIPFLMPPPPEPPKPATAFDEAEPEATDSKVEDVVRRVLEKLQPHLQELFSQGVKPLVENLVHSELTKKGK
jgi:CheY-like chemotaxis protein